MSPIEKRIDTFPRELKLILTLCSFTSSEQDNKVKELLYGGVDWKFFSDLALRHKLIPVLWPALKSYSQHIPQDTLDNIKAHFNKNVGFQLLLTSELVNLTKALNDRDIPFISLKGPLLSQSLYGDYTRRPSKDLDILVRQKDLIICHELLVEMGFSSNHDHVLFSKRKRVLYESHFYHSSYRHIDKTYQLEVHWRLTAAKFTFPISSRELFKNIKYSLVGTCPVPVLDDEYNLLYLILHGSSHRWKRLFWLYDVAAFLEKELTSEKLTNLVNDLDLTRPYTQSLYLSKLLLSVDSPTLYKISDIDDRIVESLIQSVLSILPRVRYTDGDGGLENIRMMFYQMKLKDLSIDQKLKMLRNLYLSQSDMESINFDDRYSFLYILIRPFLWTYKYFFKQKS